MRLNKIENSNFFFQVQQSTVVGNSTQISSTSSFANGASTASHQNQPNSNNDRDNECPICFDPMNVNDLSAPVEKLLKCGHEFHKACITEAFIKQGPRCPQCRELYGIPKGNQPPGKMTWSLSPGTIPGHPPAGIITINYTFPSGIQGVRESNLDFSFF